jgi:hypothetical protein
MAQFQFEAGGNGLPMNDTSEALTARNLIEVRIHSEAALTTSENITLTLVSHRGVDYNQLLINQDLATLTDYRVTKPDIEAAIEPGDRLQWQYTNTDAQPVTAIAILEGV